MWQRLKGSRLASYLALFTSFGTLLCCAIPSTLVLLGLGAGLAGFLAEYPQFIILSENKEWVFILSFLFLALSWGGQKYSERLSCPIDKKEDCETTKTWAEPVFYASAVINLIGAFYAFLLPRLL